MRASYSIPFLFSLACAHPAQREQENHTDDLAIPEALAADTVREDTMFSEESFDTVTTSRTTSGPLPTAPSDEGCADHMGYSDHAGRITLYIPEKELLAREAGIRAMLPDLYVMAEQSAPRSIADDFERGISTEHIHMPDTLPVSVRIFDRCSAPDPYTVKHYRVWKAASGGWGSDGY